MHRNHLIDRFLALFGLMRFPIYVEEPPRPPQRITLHGGPADGKSIVVQRGIGRVMIPILNADLRAVFDGGTERPMFKAAEYERDVEHYHYKENGDGPCRCGKHDIDYWKYTARESVQQAIQCCELLYAEGAIMRDAEIAELTTLSERLRKRVAQLNELNVDRQRDKANA